MVKARIAQLDAEYDRLDGLAQPTAHVSAELKALNNELDLLLHRPFTNAKLEEALKRGKPVALVDALLEAGPLRTLRDLQAMPDDQLYRCHDASVAERHKIQVPFQCGCRQWMGAGVVRVEFYSNRENVFGSQRYQDSDHASIRTLEPVPGETWQFDILPSF